MLHKKTKKQQLLIGIECGRIERSHSLRKEAAPRSGGTVVDTSVSLARWQQGEQDVARMGIVSGSAQAPRLTDITDAW